MRRPRHVAEAAGLEGRSNARPESGRRVGCNRHEPRKRHALIGGEDGRTWLRLGCTWRRVGRARRVGASRRKNFCSRCSRCPLSTGNTKSVMISTLFPVFPVFPVKKRGDEEKWSKNANSHTAISLSLRDLLFFSGNTGNSGNKPAAVGKKLFPLACAPPGTAGTTNYLLRHPTGPWRLRRRTTEGYCPLPRS